MAENGQYRIQSFAFIISVCAAFCFCCIFTPNLTGFGSFAGREQTQLDNRINPNIATVASMTRLPGIGAVKAEAIVTYRNNFHGTNVEVRAFRNLNDLQKVKGIGPKTARNVSEWLRFE
jgi:competence ComEA-like helix-hairpin-helix protein